MVASKTDHRFINSGVTVRIKTHRLSHDIRALGSLLRHKPHGIHGIEELSVRGLKTVDLGNGTRNYNAHGVRHIVFDERIRYQLRKCRRFIRL